MTDEPESGADETTADTATDDGAATTKSPSPSAQAASRARRIGGRPAPGTRPKPAPDATAVTAPKPAPAKKPATSTPEPAPETTPAPRRGGMRAARAAATQRASETKQPAVSLDKRPARKSGRVADRDADRGADRGAEPDAEALRRRLDRVRWIPAGVLGVAVVVLAVLCVVLGHGVWFATKSAAEVRGQVLSAAKTCTGAVSSYDYRKLAQSKKDGLACATGKFKADYATAMDTVVAKLAPNAKTVQSVQVAKAGVEQVSSDGKQWTVLIYGQHTVTNTTTGPDTPRLDKLSVRVTMDKVGGKWLIAKLDLAS